MSESCRRNYMKSKVSQKEALEYAYKRGYRIDKDGRALSPKGDVLLPRKCSKGYYNIVVRIKDGLHNVPYHRLMAYQKYGERLFDSECVRHLNGNQLDNSEANITIGTLSENMMDIPREKRLARAIRATKHAIVHKDVEKIREFYWRTRSYAKTMMEFSISSKGTLHYLLNKRVLV